MNLFKRKDKGKGGGRRSPRFAGTWYESDREKLTEELEGYISAAKSRLAESIVDRDPVFEDNPRPKGDLIAVVVPHAGYRYSGSTAAFSYEFAQSVRPERIILMGPSHYESFSGLALSGATVFETPLGDLPIDCQAVKELSRYPLFSIQDRVHENEHSLELQLAFLRHMFGPIKIVPVIVGVLSNPNDVRMAGQIMRSSLKNSDLIVVSSDFTHYGPRYGYVPFSDNIDSNVKQLDKDAFRYLSHGDLDGFIDFHDRTRCTICGFYPCSVLLSMLPDNVRASLLQYRTSRAMTPEDESNSVSYLSIAFTSEDGWVEPVTADPETLVSKDEKRDLLKLARFVVERFVRDGKVPDARDADVEITDNLKRPLGAFVTLFKKEEPGTADRGEQKDRSLRGCIGYIWPVKTLYEAVMDNAAGVCSKDYRFPPVRADELEDLEVEISVLTPPRRVGSEKDIELGRHGIVLYIEESQSVFLPHVATEFGWTLEETLDQLSMKAGCDRGAWRRGAEFDVFESVMFEEGETGDA